MWSVGKEATKLRNKRILRSNWTIIVEGSEKKLDFLFFVCQNILNWCEIFIVDLAGVYFLKRIFLPPPPCWSIFSSVVIYTKKISGFIHWSMYFWVKISKEKGFFHFISLKSSKVILKNIHPWDLLSLLSNQVYSCREI